MQPISKENNCRKNESVEMDKIWAFIGDPSNRDVLTWIGGGVVVLVGGLWAVLKFLVKKSDGNTARTAVTASGDRSVASGRDSHVSFPPESNLQGKPKR
jgi:hypothetical protein